MNKNKITEFFLKAKNSVLANFLEKKITKAFVQYSYESIDYDKHSPELIDSLSPLYYLAFKNMHAFEDYQKFIKDIKGNADPVEEHQKFLQIINKHAIDNNYMDKVQQLIKSFQEESFYEQKNFPLKNKDYYPSYNKNKKLFCQLIEEISYNFTNYGLKEKIPSHLLQNLLEFENKIFISRPYPAKNAYQKNLNGDDYKILVHDNFVKKIGEEVQIQILRETHQGQKNYKSMKL